MAVPKKSYLTYVVAITFAITVLLSFKTYYINYWPTDSENPYIPTAAQLFKLPFVSHMHLLPQTRNLQLTMRGKETLIIGIAVMQQLLRDDTTLFPNILLLILAIGISSILLYLIMEKLFDPHIGFLAFLLLAGSFWPYLYMLQGSHPPLALMNFLLAVFLLQLAKNRRIFYFFSGIGLGFMLFSSPTSALYLPYYIGFFAYYEFVDKKESFAIKDFYRNILLTALGISCIVLYITLPRPLYNLQELLAFMRFSQKGNNFVVYQKILPALFPLPPSMRGEGWAWIIKYFFLIMPLLFTAYGLCVFYLLWNSLKKPALVLIVATTLSTPFLVELSQVAQFGRNYFSWFIAIIFLVCFAVWQIRHDPENPIRKKYRPFFLIPFFLFLTAHLTFNICTFLSDVLPSRLATTKIHEWAIQQRTNELYTYRRHPRYKNMIQFANNPKFQNKLYFHPIDSITQVEKGLVLIPTLTGKTIWCECRESDYQKDPYLTELFSSGEFSKYVVARFPTLSSSRIWAQEEELCTYRDLAMHDISDEDRQKGFAWILDAEKIQREWFSKKRKESIEAPEKTR